MANAQQFYVDIDLSQNQLLNPLFQLVSAFPKSPKKGQFCYLIRDINDMKGNLPYYYDGIKWMPFGGGSGSGSIIEITTSNNYINITNSATSSDISIKPQTKNLFLASPIDSDGDTLFRSINILDLPDLSSLYILNQSAIIQDATFNIISGSISESLTILNSTPSNITNKLYNTNGDLYWNGSKVTPNSFGIIADSLGSPQISANAPNSTLRFGADGGLLVTFDNINNKVTYSLGSSIDVTTTNYYYYEYSIPEFVFNSPQFFYSWSKGSTAMNPIRSNSYAGIQNENTVTPIVSPISGTIKKAVMQIKGAGVQNGSVTYPVYLKCKMYKVGYTSIGSAYNVYFPISSAYQVATYAPGDTNAFVELNNLNITVTKGDMISLQFDPSTGDFGSDSTVGHLRNAFVTLVLDDSSSTGGGSGGGGSNMPSAEFDFTVVENTLKYEFSHNLNKVELIVVLIDPITGESLETTWTASTIDTPTIADTNKITITISKLTSQLYSTKTLRISIH